MGKSIKFIYTLCSSGFQIISNKIQGTWVHNGYPLDKNTQRNGCPAVQHMLKRSASRQDNTTQHTSGVQGKVQAYTQTISQRDLLV